MTNKPTGQCVSPKWRKPGCLDTYIDSILLGTAFQAIVTALMCSGS